MVQSKAKKVAPPPRGLIIVDKCRRAGGVGSSCATWPVHSFVLAFTVVQLRDVFTVLCRHNAQPTALSTSPDPAPPHPLSSNSSPHISSRRSGPTRHHIFHWEFSTPTNVQFPPKEVLDITALLEHCLQVLGIWKHIEEVKICLLVQSQWVFISCV